MVARNGSSTTTTANRLTISSLVILPLSAITTMEATPIKFDCATTINLGESSWLVLIFAFRVQCVTLDFDIVDHELFDLITGWVTRRRSSN